MRQCQGVKARMTKHDLPDTALIALGHTLILQNVLEFQSSLRLDISSSVSKLTVPHSFQAGNHNLQSAAFPKQRCPRQGPC